MSEQAPLPDGSYDAFVVDAEDSPRGVHLELTIVAGDHKGMVTALDAPATLGAALDLLGMPATLTISGGLPTVTIDD